MPGRRKRCPNTLTRPSCSGTDFSTDSPFRSCVGCCGFIVLFCAYLYANIVSRRMSSTLFVLNSSANCSFDDSPLEPFPAHTVLSSTSSSIEITSIDSPNCDAHASSIICCNGTLGSLHTAPECVCDHFDPAFISIFLVLSWHVQWSSNVGGTSAPSFAGTKYKCMATLPT